MMLVETVGCKIQLVQTLRVPPPAAQAVLNVGAMQAQHLVWSATGLGH
eukprot:SAG31_NODE_5876_length_2279_cov_1.420642_3_plen_47_part_01